MTQKMSAADLDTAAVRAMVSVVGSYTLEALLDSELRAQHKQQCAERLMTNVQGQQVQYAEQAVLANLDWGIDALEEAIGTNNYDTKIALLDHAEKMLRVCALLDSRATTAGVPNCYLASWAHFNLAFVWKLRGNDRQVANHILEMFFAEPLYSRVDFAPALWEHLFLPHLPNIVNWYTKQRQSIVASGPAPCRKMTEEHEMSLSPELSTSRDFTATSDVQVNVLNLSASQTSQLQALEKLYQDSLDENTRQYSKYYKDWLNCDLANKRETPLVPIAEPPMPDVWIPPAYGVSPPPKAGAGAAKVEEKRISTSLSSHPSAAGHLQQFKGFDNPEFVERAGLPSNSRNDLQDDVDSPTSNVRTAEPIQPDIITARPTRPPTVSVDDAESQTAEDTATPPSEPTVERSNAAQGTIRGMISMDSGMNRPPGLDLQVAKPRQRSGFGSGRFGAAASVPDEHDCNPSARSPKKVDRKCSEQKGSSSSPRMRTSLANPGEIMGRGAASTFSSSYYNTNTGSSESKDARIGRQTRSGIYHELELTLRNGTRRLSEVFTSGNASPSPSRSRADDSVLSFDASTAISDGDLTDDSSDNEAQSAPVQDPTFKPRPKERSYSNRLITPTSRPPPLRFVSRNYCDDETNSEASLDPGCGRRSDDVDDDDDDDEFLQSPSPPASVARCIPRTQSIPTVWAESPSESSASARDHADEQKCSGRNHGHGRGDSLGSVASLIGNSTMATPLMRPPKDFVCPITGQLFDDPVTLETGQTYERKAIQEWLHRGNVTCPITRQMLRISGLPKTNYVLKRLVDSFHEQHPQLSTEFGCSPLLNEEPPLSPMELNTSRILSEFMEESPEHYSPRSVSSVSSMDSSIPGRLTRRFSRRTFAETNDPSSLTNPLNVDGLIMDLKLSLTCLCLSEDFAECESVILDIAGLFQEARGDQKMVAILNKAGVIDGMMEVLSNSTQVLVLSATLFLLSGLISRDEMTRKTVVSADPEVKCLIGLLRKGMTLSVVVLYQLRLPNQQLASLDLLPLLIIVIKQTEENHVRGLGHREHDLMIRPKAAAIMLLEQIVTGGDQATLLKNTQALSALEAMPALISRLDQALDIDERTSVVSLLLCCMQSDGRIRNMVAQMSNLVPVVELLHNGNNRARTVAIAFFNDLVRLNRRAFCNGILQTVKAGGLLSSMHVVLVHLQMAPLEHRPVAASLLLQLDLLEEPRRRSMYRDEALDSLVEALTSTERPCPLEAATMLISLGGRFSYSGKSMMEVSLLKTAGMEKCFLTFMKDELDSSEHSPVDQDDEEKAAKIWERRVARALVGHELGTLIEALGQGIQSKNPKLSRQCMIVATWLTHLLPKLPDTGVRQTARNCLLDHFVEVLQTSKDLQQRVLAALAINSFISNPEGVQELLSHVKDICGPLRQLKKSTWVARKILRTFTAHVDANSPDLWAHAEHGQLDNSAHGEVRALARARSRIFSGHSDGTIKVWDAKKQFPVLLQECKEHTKSVTALSVSVNSDRLYSGSLDKSIKVWALGTEQMNIVHVFDLKEAITGLVVNRPMACIIPHGAGIKVQFEESGTKSLNSHKHVQSLAIGDGRIFCGCTDNSVQEVDPISGSVDSIQHGTRTLLGKKSIYGIQVFQDLLYVAGSPVDGVAGKVWKLSDYSLVGSLRTTAEVRSMAVSEDFIYLGSNSGVIEVWLRERLLKVATLNAGSKVISLMLDGDTVYSGCEDGKIRVWARTMI